MNQIREYLLSVCCAALLLSLISALVPKGNVKRYVNFIGSLLIVLAVIVPIKNIDSEDLAKAISEFSFQYDDAKSDIEVKNRELIEQIIMKECAAYILDKAEQIGASVTVELQMSEDMEYPFPVSIVVSGQVSEEKQKILERIIADDLGIPKERQGWKTIG